MGLSENNFTYAEKLKLSGLENYDDTDVRANITETTEQTALNRSTLGYQRKNLLKNTSSSVTKYGLTYTNNADGSITVNGEATQNVIHKIGSISVNGELSFILSGTAVGSSSAGYNLQCRRNNATIARDLGNGTTITTSEDFDIAIYIFGGTVCDNITFCPMLRYTDITDNTYEPYKPSVAEYITETTDQTALNRSTLGYQRKNLLKNTAKSQIVNGVMFTINDDGTVEVSGTADNAVYFSVADVPSETEGMTMWLSGCPTGGDYQDGYALYVYRKSNSVTVGYDTGDACKIAVPAEPCSVRILVRKGATVNNLIFRPMLRYAKVGDDTYEPYRPSVADSITELISVNKATIGYHRKNLLENNCKTTTNNGITATINADSSITISGSNTSTKDFVFYYNFGTESSIGQTQFDNNKKIIPNGRYYISGGSAGCVVQVCVSADNINVSVRAIAYASDVAFTITDNDKYVWFRLLIKGSADFSTPVTVYPMVRYVDITITHTSLISRPLQNISQVSKKE